jgi:hypothetical protein
MKKTALIAAAAALMAATPAAANGYLGLEYGSGEIDFGGPSTDTDVWQGEGAFGFGGPGWGGQIDGSIGNVEADTGGDADAWTFAGHLWWAGSNWRFGGVIGGSSSDDSGSSVDDMIYGVEGTWDFTPNAQFVSSLTAGETEFIGTDLDTFNWDAGMNFFPSPNIRLGGFFGVGNIDGGAADADTTSFGLNGEFQPWSTPVSITLGWNSFEVDDLDLESDVFTIGARWNFGGGTLQDRHNAAPFDTNTGFGSRIYGVW